MEKLIQLQTLTLSNLQQVINYAETEGLTNSQEFINFLDRLNEYSVRY